MTDSTFIEVREGWKKYYLFWFFAGLLISFAAIFISEQQQRQSIATLLSNGIFFFPLVGFVLALCLYYYFDKRVKVRIDSNGIWSRRHRNVAWDDIWYFNSTSSSIRGGDRYKLHVRMKDTETSLDKEITLRFRRMDKSFEEIRSVVEYYAAKYNIQDLGHEKEE